MRTLHATGLWNVLLLNGTRPAPNTGGDPSSVSVPARCFFLSTQTATGLRPAFETLASS